LAKEFSCPSCGADLKLKGTETHVVCPYCESTVLIPDEFRRKPERREPEHTAETPDYAAAHRAAMQKAAMEQAAKSASFGRWLGCLLPILIVGFVMVMNFLFNPAFRTMFESTFGKAASAVGLAEAQEVLSFGGEGTGAGLFEDARHITVDGEGTIYVAEYGSGRVQLFDGEGSFQTQWFLGEGDDVYISGMDAMSDGRLVIALSGELWIHDGETGERIRMLEHPDGWGFDDVCVADDGSIVTTWYCNRDDLVRFDPQGRLDLHVPEAISGVTGDSELDSKVTVDGQGNIYLLGTFNYAVLKYTRSGEFSNRFASEGDEDGQLTSPGVIEADGQGNIHVSDMWGVQVYAPDGRWLGEWLEGAGYIFGMDYRDGMMYTVDANQRVRVLRVPSFD
jgi:DNA-directed RNA polymerase subunit RPC12/RpoP